MYSTTMYSTALHTVRTCRLYFHPTRTQLVPYCNTKLSLWQYSRAGRRGRARRSRVLWFGTLGTVPKGTLGYCTIGAVYCSTLGTVHPPPLRSPGRRGRVWAYVQVTLQVTRRRPFAPRPAAVCMVALERTVQHQRYRTVCSHRRCDNAI